MATLVIHPILTGSLGNRLNPAGIADTPRIAQLALGGFRWNTQEKDVDNPGILYGQVDLSAEDVQNNI